MAIPIIGFEGLYTIDKEGNVFSSYSNRNLKARNSKLGYKQVELWKNNKGKKEYIHRLVANHFLHNDDPINKTFVAD